MKLLYCPSCGDLVKLRAFERHCACGQCAGRYLSAKIGETRAIVSGPRVQVVGIDNHGFLRAMVKALSAQVEGNTRDDYYLAGNAFDAWVFGPNALALTKRGHDEVTKA